jgi:hypothetical protein
MTPYQKATRLEHLIYASAATAAFGAQQLTELLEKARTSNEQTGLTGMLLHSDSDGSFFQVVEGEAETIDELWRKLSLDARHEQLTVIIREPILHRSFAQWSMGFSTGSLEKLRQIPGVNDFFQDGACFQNLDAGRARRLLAAFAGGSWRPNRVGGTEVAA